ncbi:MAG: hypothetical protein DRJ03_02675 [Chloroflexi bacterium]|nr:MAG: hypothetical protein DRJ03_02675 [Chloroflexota bacterium]
MSLEKIKGELAKIEGRLKAIAALDTPEFKEGFALVTEYIEAILKTIAESASSVGGKDMNHTFLNGQQTAYRNSINVPEDIKGRLKQRHLAVQKKLQEEQSIEIETELLKMEK